MDPAEERIPAAPTAATDPFAGLDPARFAIRFVDGSTTASPLRGAVDRVRLVDDASGGIPTARLLAALSVALDLTEGQLPGHALRTGYLALRLADPLGLADDELHDLFNAAFLKDAGCSSNAAAVTSIFGGSDQELKGRQATIDRVDPGVCRLHDPEPAGQRAAPRSSASADPDRARDGRDAQRAHRAAPL